MHNLLIPGGASHRITDNLGQPSMTRCHSSGSIWNRNGQGIRPLLACSTEVMLRCSSDLVPSGIRDRERHLRSTCGSRYRCEGRHVWPSILPRAAPTPAPSGSGTIGPNHAGAVTTCRSPNATSPPPSNTLQHCRARSASKLVCHGSLVNQPGFTNPCNKNNPPTMETAAMARTQNTSMKCRSTAAPASIRIADQAVMSRVLSLRVT